MTQVLVIAGPGTLGRSLAGWAARCGLQVRLVGRSLAHAQTGVVRVWTHWDREVARGRMTPEDREAARMRLEACEDLSLALQGAQVLLEALPEDLAAKAAFWRAVGALPEGILCLTGSSSLPVTALHQAAGLARPLLGFHLFVPVDRMSVVELVVPPDAPPEAVERARTFGAVLQKQIAQARDQAGYAASRLALVQGLEAMRLLEQGVAAAEDLDALMVKGYGHPVGPLELSDRVGLDLRLAIADQLFAATGDPRFAPPAILREHVAAGWTGRAAGRGFYRWTPEKETP